MVQNVSTMVQNGPKMVQNGPKWSKMVLNNPNNFPKFPNQNFQDRSGRVGASQGESGRVRASRGKSGRVRASQNDSGRWVRITGQSKIVQNVSKMLNKACSTLF